MTNFKAKNEARKLHFRGTEGQDRRIAREARLDRRARGGAFGREESKRLRNEMAYGTGGFQDHAD